MLAVWAEFGPLLEKLLGRQIPVAQADWRPGDQRVFYADVRKAQAANWAGSRGSDLRTASTGSSIG